MKQKVVEITETVAQCVGYEDLYSVTKNGVVYSLPRRGRKLKLMRPVDNMKTGYLRAALTKEGRTKFIYIHRLVAEAYIPNPQNKPMVNHIDGNKRNNNVENLEWVTAIENITKAFEMGLRPQQKIHPEQKKVIYEMVITGVPVKRVAGIYGVKPGGIYSLVKRYREAEQRMAA